MSWCSIELEQHENCRSLCRDLVGRRSLWLRIGKTKARPILRTSTKGVSVREEQERHEAATLFAPGSGIRDWRSRSAPVCAYALSRLKTAVSTVFVAFSTSNEDPNTEFLRKFENQKIRALPISAAARSDNNTWIDKRTGARGIALRIERIDLIDFYNARVPCSWSADPSGELPLIYQVSWKRGKWVVL